MIYLSAIRVSGFHEALGPLGSSILGLYRGYKLG